MVCLFTRDMSSTRRRIVERALSRAVGVSGFAPGAVSVSEARLEIQPTKPVLPHRKVIRFWLAPLSSRNTPRVLALVVLDLPLFAGGMAVALLAENPLVQLLAGAPTGIVISRLVVLGHDACHQGLTPHRGLNRRIGCLVFLSSLTPYSLWEVATTWSTMATRT